MTNAEMHVAALEALYGPCPIAFEALRCRVLSATANGEDLVIHLEWWGDDEIRHAEEWIYPQPEVWLPDPAGDVARYEQALDEYGNPVFESGTPVMVPVMGRISPVEVADPQFRRQVESFRSRQNGEPG